jgi:hypothetical protein
MDMPPHCDSLDGPVVTAARDALQQNNVQLALPYVSAADERELGQAFDLAVKARAPGAEAGEVADRWFSKLPCGCTEPRRGLRSPGSSQRVWTSGR